MATQITGKSADYSTTCSGQQQRKHHAMQCLREFYQHRASSADSVSDVMTSWPGHVPWTKLLQYSASEEPYTNFSLCILGFVIWDETLVSINIKMRSYQRRDSCYKDKTISWTSDGNPISGKTDLTLKQGTDSFYAAYPVLYSYESGFCAVMVRTL